jgi:hypothetical protein
MNPMFSEPVYWFGIDAGIVLAAIALGMYVFGVRWLARIRHDIDAEGPSRWRHRRATASWWQRIVNRVVGLDG